VTRWREERERGLENEQAVLAAGATAGHAVVLSGVTVAVGLLSLIVLPVPFLRSIGIGGMLIPLVAIAAAVTLLPVTLAAWGPRLDRHRIARTSSTLSHAWHRWGALVVRRRIVFAIAGVAVVAALAAPALTMNTGQPDVAAYPTATAGGKNTPGARARRIARGRGVSRSRCSPTVVPQASRGPFTIADSTPGVYTSLAPATMSFSQRKRRDHQRHPAHAGQPRRALRDQLLPGMCAACERGMTLMIASFPLRNDIVAGASDV